MTRILILPSLILLSLAGGAAAEPPAPLAPVQQLPTLRLRIPGSTVEYEMVRIPAGTIEMPGAAESDPPRQVQVKSIWVGRLEVTWDVYGWWAFGRGMTQAQRCAEVDARTLPSIPYRDVAEGWGQENQPALRMTLHSANLFCQWLSKQTGKKCRLPTEAEWEYACRAGGPPLQNLDAGALKEIAWYRDSAATDDYPDGRPHTGGLKKPNAWGLYDMLGNVSEWVQPENGRQFTKGGAWNTSAARANSSRRFYFKDNWQMTDPEDPRSRWWLSDAPFVGFRVVMEAPE